METGQAQPVRFEEVSILFVDFKDFTSIVATMPTKSLVRELNDIFQKIDDIIQSEGLEKIKTIGDAYLAAGGLPKEDPNHALNCVQAAKRIITFLQKRNQSSGVKWKARVGIHSGPITAGVVGKRKFTYDLFGDTINIASRIETAGEAGQINVSAYTYDLIKGTFPCKYRGKINAKGKGEIDMYFVED
jgi:class 3 adenylate cyclase